MGKRIVAWIVGITMTLSLLAGCGRKKAADTTAQEDGKIHVKAAFLPEVMDDNQTAIKTAFEMVIEEYNNSEGTYYFDELLVQNADGDVDRQIGYLENLSTQEVNVAVCFPVDVAGIVPGFVSAAQAGVGVADWYGCDTEEKICNMKFNESISGGIVRDYIDKYLEENPNAVIKAGLVYPDPTSTSMFGRCDAVAELEEKYPERFEVIVMGYGNWATDDTQALVEDWIQTYPNINYNHCANDESALGAINALKSAGIKENVLVTGINGGEAGCNQVADGSEYCSVAQDKMEMARATVDAWVAYLDGTIDEHIDEDKNLDTTNYEVYKLLTKDNVEEWNAYLKETGL